MVVGTRVMRRAARPTLFGFRSYIVSRAHDKKQRQQLLQHDMSNVEVEHEAEMHSMQEAAEAMATCKDLVALNLAHRCDELEARLQEEVRSSSALALQSEKLEEMRVLKNQLREAEELSSEREAAMTKAHEELVLKDTEIETLRAALEHAKVYSSSVPSYATQ